MNVGTYSVDFGVGEAFDFSKVVKSPAWAPEFAGIEEWINSKPLTMAELKGKVVVVHFFAFASASLKNFVKPFTS